MIEKETIYATLINFVGIILMFIFAYYEKKYAIVFPLIFFFITHIYFKKKFWKGFFLSILLTFVFGFFLISDYKSISDFLDKKYESNEKGTTKVDFYNPKIVDNFYGHYLSGPSEEEMKEWCYECLTSDIPKIECEYRFESRIKIESDKNKDNIKCEIYLNNNKIENIEIDDAERRQNYIVGGFIYVKKLYLTDKNTIKVCCDNICTEKTYKNLCEDI